MLLDKKIRQEIVLKKKETYISKKCRSDVTIAEIDEKQPEKDGTSQLRVKTRQIIEEYSSRHS